MWRYVLLVYRILARIIAKPCIFAVFFAYFAEKMKVKIMKLNTQLSRATQSWIKRVNGYRQLNSGCAELKSLVQIMKTRNEGL